MDRYQYLLRLGALLAVTLPLEFVPGARVWRRPARLVRTLWLPFVLVLAWEEIAVARHHWRYRPRYLTGWDVPFNLPIEEVVFLAVLPICGLLVFEAMRRLVGNR